MKKFALILGLTAIIYLGIYLFEQYELGKNINWQVNNWAFDNITPTSIDFLISISIFNNSDFSATLKNVDLIVFINGIQGGTITDIFNIFIPAKGPGLVQLKIKVLKQTLQNMGLQILDEIISKKNIPIDIIGNFKLKSLVGAVTIPIQYSTNYKNLKSLYLQYFK